MKLWKIILFFLIGFNSRRLITFSNKNFFKVNNYERKLKEDQFPKIKINKVNDENIQEEKKENTNDNYLKVPEKNENEMKNKDSYPSPRINIIGPTDNKPESEALNKNDSDNYLKVPEKHFPPRDKYIVY